ncbi:MAG: hypothetical protein AB1726_01885 [Planctomycetota bacterium]
MIQGSEILLFLDQGARFQIAGNQPGLLITAPQSGTYEGVSVFQHRQNALPGDISGSGRFDIAGTLYLKAGHLEMDGNVDRRVGRIVVNSQLLRGNGRYIVTGIGPPPTGPYSAFLVR